MRRQGPEILPQSIRCEERNTVVSQAQGQVVNECHCIGRFPTPNVETGNDLGSWIDDGPEPGLSFLLTDIDVQLIHFHVFQL